MADTRENILLEDLPRIEKISYEQMLVRAEKRRAYIASVGPWFLWHSLAGIPCNHPDPSKALGGAPTSTKLHHGPQDSDSYQGLLYRTEQVDIGIPPSEVPNIYHRGKFHFWGIDRYTYEWILGTVTYEIFEQRYKLTNVQIRDRRNGIGLTQLLHFAQISVEDVWEKLGQAIRAWNERRKQVYLLSEAAVYALNVEEAVIGKN